MSFRRFAVVGQGPSAVEEQLLERLAEHALRERDLGVPDEIEYGWCGGRHLLDTSFTFENNVFADALVFGLRIDTNKVPGDLKKAYTMIEEDSVAETNPSGFISKNQRRDAKDVVRRKLDDELRSGRFRRSKMTQILWDLPGSMLYCNASTTAQEKLLEIFERTFGLTLQPLSSGSLAIRSVEQIGHRRDYEDCRPTRFVIGPGGESQPAEYPWVAKSSEKKDFLGNEFLLWLWHEADQNGGAVKLDASDSEVSFLIDRSVELDCVFGATGKAALRGTGPAHMPEALDGLRSGKVPRKAGLILEHSGMAYNLNFTAESFAISGLKLPDVEEADTARVLFEERIAMLRTFGQSIDALYETFLKVRLSGAWERATGRIRKWIQQSGKPGANSPVEVIIGKIGEPRGLVVSS